jgi:outer membrane protein
MMIICCVLGIVLWGNFPKSAGAEDKPKTYTVKSSIVEAMAASYTLKAIEERLNQAMSVKNQARSELLPKLGVSYGYNRLGKAPTINFMDVPTPITVGTQDNYRFVGTLSQPIFTGFGLLSSYKLSKLGIDQSEMDIELAKLDLALSVKDAYYNILIADAAIDVASKSVEALESAANVARNFHKVGMVPVNDVLKAEVDLGNSVQALTRTKNAARLARAAFNTVLVRDVNAPVEVEDVRDVHPHIGTFEEYRELALANRPEIKLIDINIEKADQQINLAKSKYWPEIALTYNYSRTGDTPSVNGGPFHDPATQWEVNIGAQWTFWEWGKTYYSQKAQESVKQELSETKNNLIDSITLEVKQAILDLETAIENIPTTEKAVKQGEENLRVNQERYKAQVTTITELLDAQRLLSQARVNYFTALYTTALAKATLDRAIGTY